jgi:hypothetical protein
MNKRGGWEDQSVHRRNGAGLGEHTGEARDRLCGAQQPSALRINDICNIKNLLLFFISRKK